MSKAEQEKALKVKGSMYIVGIGSSAGGLEALGGLISQLPDDSNAAFIIAQHLSPTHRSLLTELLGRQTSIPVTEVKDKETLKPNRIFVCPPNHNIEISDGDIVLKPLRKEPGPKPSVDRLFNSLAREVGKQAVGIILSGTGSDGAHGSLAIRVEGGLTIAQDPQTAQYDSMPEAAISIGGAELILSPDDIGKRLVELMQQTNRKDTSKSVSVSEDSGPLGTIVNLIWEQKQLDFSRYKESTLCRQIDRRVVALQLENIDAYLDYLKQHTEEYEVLVRSFMISVTNFFRDKKAFEELGTRLEQISRGKNNDQPLRIWVPGCATGEEAYTIAILLIERLGINFAKVMPKIFATDIDETALQFARQGVYSETALDGLSSEQITRYFRPEASGFRVSDKLKDMVLFSRQDLIGDPPFIHVDVVSCRNVLIYFKPELQEFVFRIFHHALNPMGFLLLGNSEVVSAADGLFDKVGSERIYQRNNVQSTTPLMLRPAIHRRPASSSAAPAKKTPKKSSQDIMRKALVRSFAPTSALLDQDLNVVELYGETQHFFKMGEGTMDLNIHRLIHPEFKSILRSTLHRLNKDNLDYSISNIASRMDDGKPYRLRASKEYADSGQTSGKPYTLICFELVKENSQKPILVSGEQITAEVDHDMVESLQHELDSTRAHLQTVIEELEGSNEELASLNEEMQASSEELQASNEELATSNEELQSTNEELSTVNDELNQKSQLLLSAKDDLENVQNATSTALVVVDRDLLVKYYNAAAIRVLGLTEADIGRNLTSLPIRMPLGKLVEPLKLTLNGTHHPELEISDNHFSYRTEIHPYTSQNGEILGAVISLSDVSELQKNQSALREANELFSIFSTHSQAVLWVQEPNFGRFIYLSNAFSKIYGLETEMALRDSRYIFKVMDPHDQKSLMDVHTKNAQLPWQIRTRIVHPKTGKSRWLLTRGYPVFKHDRLTYITGFTVDDTDNMEKKLSSDETAKVVSMLLDASPDAFVTVDSNMNIISANIIAAELLGEDKEALKGSSITELLLPDEADALNSIIETNSCSRRTLFRNSTSTDEHIQEVIISGGGTAGLPNGTAASVVIRANHSLSDDYRRLVLQANVFRNTREGIILLDKETRVVEANPSALQILQTDSQSIIGRVLEIFPHRIIGSSFSNNMYAQLERGSGWVGELRIVVAESINKTIEVDLRVLNKHSSEDRAEYLLMLKDVTERHDYEETIRRQANFDALTGLPNRVLLLDRLNQELRHAAREGSSVTLMFLDLDRFKEVNDTMGHEAGDHLLEQVAGRVSAELRSSDTFSRFGGDEFVIVMPKYHRSQAPELFARHLIDKLEEPFSVDNQQLFISASAGIVVFPEDGTDASELLSNADAAMYEAKRSGGRGFAYHQKSMNQEARQRIVLERELRNGIENREIVTYYQPFIDSDTLQTNGAEALVRWKHPDLGLVGPDDFIPYAEESGLIDAITTQVLADALLVLETSRDKVKEGYSISVNLSGRSLMRTDLRELFHNASSKVDQGSLEGLIVEMTESVFIKADNNLLRDNLNWLQSKNVLISLDDFGTGYSALSYIRDFPIDIIKIDKAFVSEASHNTRDRALIKATIQMAHGIGAKVVAEGVETEEQKNIVIDLGVDFLQGYYFAHPMPADELSKYTNQRLEENEL